MKKDYTAFFVFLLVIFLTSTIIILNHEEGHYDDKGYRICMHVIDPDSDNGSPIDSYGAGRIAAACIEKYAGIKVEQKSN